MRRGEATLKGQYDHRNNKLITPAAIHESVRIVWRNGKLAVWREDTTAWTADRIFLIEGVSFRPRANAREPHLLILPAEVEGSTETEWIVQPLYAGGCGCLPYPLKGIPRERLLSPDFSHHE